MGHATRTEFFVRADGIVGLRRRPVIGSADLAQRLADDHGGREGDVEAATAAAHRDRQARIGAVVDRLRNAGRFAAEQQNVSIREGEARVGEFRPGGQKHQPSVLLSPLILETRKVDVPGEGGHFDIVHASPFERAIRNVETRGLNQVDADAEAGRHAQHGPGVAGDIGLVQRKSNSAGHAWLNQLALRISHIVRTLRQSCTERVAKIVEHVYRPRRANSNLRRREWNS